MERPGSGFLRMVRFSPVRCGKAICPIHRGPIPVIKCCESVLAEGKVVFGRRVAGAERGREYAGRKVSYCCLFSAFSRVKGGGFSCE